jgi:hypothetical protein
MIAISLLVPESMYQELYTLNLVNQARTATVS